MIDTTVRLSTAVLAALAISGCGMKPTVWQKVVDTGADETAVAIATGGINIYAAANVEQPGGSSSTWLIRKLSRDGTDIWTRTYKDAPVSACGDIVADGQDNLFVVGRAVLSGKQLCVIARYGIDGSLSWQKGLDIGDNTSGTGICLLSDRRIAICGVTGSEANTDHMVAVLDGDGKTLWSHNYDICCADIARAIAADAKDNLAFVGQHCDGDNTDIIIVKLDAKGDTVWTRRYDSGGQDTPGDIAFDPFGNLVATGTAVVGDSTRCVILEYDPDGGVIRKAAYGEQAMATGRAICINDKSDIFVTGELLGKDRSEVLVFQYVPGALSVWERHYAPGTTAEGVDLVVPDDAYVLATVKNKTNDMAVYRFSRPPAGPAATR